MGFDDADRRGERGRARRNVATTPRIAVVGAGLAGLAAASVLAASGLAVRVFEKSYGLGGRLAARRPFRNADRSDFFVEHGAPAAEPGRKAGDPAAQARWRDLIARSGAAPWPAFSADAVVAGEGAPAFAAALARRLASGDPDRPIGAIHPSVEIAEIAAGEDDLLLIPKPSEPGGTAAPLGPFDGVVCAAPAPQAQRLLGAAAPASEFAAQMRPVLSVILVTDAPLTPADAPAVIRPDEGPLELIVRQAGKPGAGPDPDGLDAWVGHARLDASQTWLEADKAAIAHALSPALCDALGAPPPAQPRYLAGHRWRYAYATKPQGRAYWLSEDGRIGLCGDWRLGSKAGDALESGARLGAAMAERFTAL